jgi:hypothetical protein
VDIDPQGRGGHEALASPEGHRGGERRGPSARIGICSVESGAAGPGTRNISAATRWGVRLPVRAAAGRVQPEDVMRVKRLRLGAGVPVHVSDGGFDAVVGTRPMSGRRPSASSRATLRSTFRSTTAWPTCTCVLHRAGLSACFGRGACSPTSWQQVDAGELRCAAARLAGRPGAEGAG